MISHPPGLTGGPTGWDRDARTHRSLRSQRALAANMNEVVPGDAAGVARNVGCSIDRKEMDKTFLSLAGNFEITQLLGREQMVNKLAVKSASQ